MHVEVLLFSMRMTQLSPLLLLVLMGLDLIKVVLLNFILFSLILSILNRVISFDSIVKVLLMQLLLIVNVVVLVKRLDNWRELSALLFLLLILERISATQAIVKVVVKDHLVGMRRAST